MLNNLFKCTGSIIKVLFLKILIEQVQEQRNFIWSLKHLEKCVWRTASEETSLKKSSWRHVIRSTGHQKHILLEATSLELTKDIVRSVRPRTLQPPSLQSLSLQQDKDNSNIVADVVPLVMEWIWIKFFIGQLSNQAKRSRVKNQSFKARQVDVTAKFSTSLNSSINRDEDLENWC